MIGWLMLNTTLSIRRTAVALCIFDALQRINFMMWLSTCSNSTCLDLPSLTLGIQYHKQCFMFVYISSYSHIHVVYIDISKKKTACSAVHAVHVHSSKSTCIVLPLWLMHFMPQLARLICERLEPGRQGGQHVMKPHFFPLEVDMQLEMGWEPTIPLPQAQGTTWHELQWSTASTINIISYLFYWQS